MRLSIITVNLNNQEGLQTTVDSVLSQSWHDFEWIVIDGGSSDGSKAIIERYQHHFSYWCSESDDGIYPAMNKGIRLASGEYCLFLNSGDWFYSPHVLENAFAKEVSKDIVSFDQLLQTGKDRFEYINKITGPKLTASQLILGTLPHQATFIRRSLFSRFGCYDETFRIVSDWKFFLEVLVLQNASFQYYPMIMSCVQANGISLANDKERESERKRVLASCFPQLVLDDYNQVHSLSYVMGGSWLCRRLYGLLFRLADFTYKLK